MNVRAILFVIGTVSTGGALGVAVFFKRISDSIDAAYADLSFYDDNEVLG